MLSGAGRKRRRLASSGKQQSDEIEAPGEGDRDEAAKFIAQAIGDLAEIAQSHRLDHLRYLLAVARMEAEEYVRLRSKQRLS